MISFIDIYDDDSNLINLCIYSQKTGRMVSKHKLFTMEGGAVENSVVAYNTSFYIGAYWGFLKISSK